MFERYTEKSRRVIFFARYEASEFGSSYIETEHLLLGLAREQRWVLQLIPNLQVDSLRARIEALVSVGKKFPTSVDLPLSNECKRVLAHAAEEAERLASDPITPAHLLLGLLHETDGLAAKILIDSGANLSELRQAIAKFPRAETAEEEAGANIVTIHGCPCPSRHIESAAANAKRFLWNRQKFIAPDIVLHRDDSLISFDLKLIDNSADFQLIEGGWQETTCCVCRWEFKESEDAERGVGYTNGRDWICSECHDRFVKPATP